MKNKHIFIPVIIIVLLYLLVWNSNLFGYMLTPVVTLGFIFALASIVLKSASPPQVHDKMSWDKITLLIAGVSVVGLFLYANYIFTNNPIDIAKSDIIPLIKEVYYDRFVKGQYVYDRVVGYDYKDWTPNYLPMHWLPFVPALLMNVDPRWVAFILFMCVQTWYIVSILKSNFSNLEKRVKVLIPLIMLFSVMHKQQNSFAHSVELLICSYYMLIAMGLNKYNNSTVSVGFVLTVLSRYVSVFFAPVYAFHAFLSNRINAFKFLFILLIGVLLLYVFPFMRSDPMIFFDGAAAYDIAALGEWKGQSWQAAGDPPYQLFQGYGFASWVYKFYPATILATKIHFLKNLLLLVMILNVVFGLVYVWKYRPDMSSLPALLIITLGVFFSFVLVPYNYLFWNVLFLLPIATMHIRWFEQK